MVRLLAHCMDKYLIVHQSCLTFLCSDILLLHLTLDSRQKKVGLAEFSVSVRLAM